MKNLILALALVVGFGNVLCVRAAEPATRPTTQSAGKSIRVYHIGNSLTFGVLANGNAAHILSSRGVKYNFGWHILWGSSLAQIWEKADKPSVKSDAYGNFMDALSNHSWDVLTLQAHNGKLDGDDGDVAVAKKFIELAMNKSPDIQVYIFETWPSKEKGMKPDFAAKWVREYDPKGKDWGIYNGTYCKDLVNRLNKEMPALKNPVGLIPGGSVLFEMDALMKAGKVSGFERIEQVYADNTHLNPVGWYMALCTFYAVIEKDNPKGLAGSVLDKAITDDLAGIIQDATWKVVSHMDLTGVNTH